MNKKELELEISKLHNNLQDPSLSEVDKISIKNQIGFFEDELSLLDFQEVEDFDWGYHDQLDF